KTGSCAICPVEARERVGSFGCPERRDSVCPCTWCRLRRRLRAPTPRSGGCLSFGIDDHARVQPVHVARVATEELGRVILRLRGGKAIVATDSPAVVRRVPFDASADVARQIRFITVHTELRPLEHRESTNAADPV